MIKFLVLATALLLLASSFVLGPRIVSMIMRPKRWARAVSYSAGVALALCVAVALIYMKLGTTETPGLAAAAPAISDHAASRKPGRPALPLEQVALQLEARLSEQPNDPSGWALLVKTYRRLGLETEAERVSRLATKHGYTPNQTRADSSRANHGIEQVLSTLRERIEQSPDDATAWSRLGRAYMSRRRFPEAVEAFEKALDLDGKNARLLADTADAKAAINNLNFDSETTALIERALAIDPGQTKALWLAGTSAYKKGDQNKARAHWSRLLEVLPPGSADARAVTKKLASLDVGTKG